MTCLPTFSRHYDRRLFRFIFEMLNLHVPWIVVGLTEKQFPLTGTTRIWGGLCVFVFGRSGEIIVVVFETSQGLLNVK